MRLYYLNKFIFVCCTNCDLVHFVYCHLSYLRLAQELAFVTWAGR